MLTTLEIKIDEIDTLIRRGEIRKAQEALIKICESRVPHDEVTEVASLARRASLPLLAVRLLNPLVRPSGKQKQQASDEVRAEYAVSLTYLGANEEAVALLKSVDSSVCPQALLYTAFAQFNQWDYAGAIPILNRYMGLSSLLPYQKAVGSLNLAAALVHERYFEKANNLLTDLLKETTRQQWTLIHGDVLHLLAENCLNQENWGAAERYLKEAKQFLGTSGGANAFLLKKWEVVLHLKRHKLTDSLVQELQSVKAEAKARFLWEVVRDCDKYSAIAQKDAGLLTHLYYGTPFASYRRLIEKDWGKPLQIPLSYTWHLKRKKEITEVFDILSGGKAPSGDRLKVGQVPERLLATLCTDFYRPFRTATLHSQLFPDEFFHPASSPPKVYEAVRRLREWFQENKLPLKIDENEGFYHLTASKPCALLLRAEAPVESSQRRLLLRLKELWPLNPFSSKEVSEALSVSPRTSLRLLKQAEKEGELTATGKFRTTLYRFK